MFDWAHLMCDGAANPQLGLIKIPGPQAAVGNFSHILAQGISLLAFPNGRPFGHLLPVFLGAISVGSTWLLKLYKAYMGVLL